MNGSIQNTGDGKWRLVFDLGRDAFGKRRQKVVRFRGNKKEAQKKLRDLIGEYENGGMVEPSKMTVGEYLADWLELKKTLGLSPNTWEGYEVICRRHLIPAFGQILLQKLRPDHIESYYSSLLNGGRQDKKPGGLSPKTIANIHGVLSKAYSDALKKRHISWDPTEAVETPKIEEQEVAALTKQELAVVLNAFQGRTHYPIILLAAMTGMRRGEVLGLQWQNTNLDEGWIYVKHSLAEIKGRLFLKEPKTKASRRRINIPDIVVQELRRWKAKQSLMRVQLGLGKDENDLVFTTLKGGMMAPSIITAEFGEVIRTLGITVTPFHGLRHTHTTHLLSDGVPLHEVVAKLGHSNANQTLNRYAHVIPQTQSQSAQKYGAEMQTLLERAEND